MLRAPVPDMFGGRYVLKTLFIASTSACFELENASPYYAPEKYACYLNGKWTLEGETNVFSLFGLLPGCEYSLLLAFEGGGEEQLRFRTSEERCAVSVRDFGAAGDGAHDDTLAIQAAVSFLPEGGRLYFPPGVYRSLPLALKSHIHLELAEGAVLLASPEKERYPILPGWLPDLNSGLPVHFAGFEGAAQPSYQSLLTASGATDVTITGPGCVDGSGGVFWNDIQNLPAARPRLIFLNRCRRVRIHGLTLRDSPSWQLHPYYSEDIGLYDLKVEAPPDSPNTDAVDPESCDGVEIVGCRFCVGDDCIAVKSGKRELAEALHRPAVRHTVRNCLMERGHGAVTLGSEIGAGVRELSVSRCLFLGTDRGLRIKTRRGRGKGCRVDGVSFDNIRMDGVKTPIAVNMWYNCCDPDRYSEYVWSREALPVDGGTPSLGRLSFRDILCENAHAAACYVDGLPESPVEEVELKRVRVCFAPDARPAVPVMKNFAEPCCRLGLYFDNVRRVRLEDVVLRGAAGEGLTAHNCGEISRDGLAVLP